MPAPTPADDLVLPFQLEGSVLRGRLVRLGPALDAILRRHDYPQTVGTLLGETVSISAALATALKYDGVFTLQTKSDGAVRMLVADVTNDGGMRAYAQFDAERLNEDKVMGEGHLAFTVDLQADAERYQGVVALQGDNLAEAVQHYFRQSEQIVTGIIAAARRGEDGAWRGGCLMVQKMPRAGGHEIATDTSVEDDWRRAMVFMQTCKPEELTAPDLSAEQLLFRLFHEEGVRIYDAKSLSHRCRCSEERVTSMLRSLPRAEVEALAVNGVATVTCEFCNRFYAFDQAQLAALYGSKP